MTFSSKTLIQGLAFSAYALQGVNSVALRALIADNEAPRCAEDFQHVIKGDVHRMTAKKNNWQNDSLLEKIKEMLLLTDDEASEIQTLKVKVTDPDREIGILQWVREMTLKRVLLDSCEKFQGYRQDEAHLAAALIYSREQSNLISLKFGAHKYVEFRMAELQRSRDEARELINITNGGKNPSAPYSEARIVLRLAYQEKARIENLKRRIVDLYRQFVFDDVKTSWLNRNVNLSIWFGNFMPQSAPLDNAIQELSGEAEVKKWWDARARGSIPRGQRYEVTESRNSRNALVDLYANKIGQSWRASRFLSKEPSVIGLDDASQNNTLTSTMIRFLLQRPEGDVVHTIDNIPGMDLNGPGIVVNRFSSFDFASKLVSILSSIELRLASATPTPSPNDASLRNGSSSNSHPVKCLADLVLSDGVRIIFPMHIAFLQMVRDYNKYWSRGIMGLNENTKNSSEYSWLKGYALAFSDSAVHVEEITKKMVEEQYEGDAGKFMDHFINNIDKLREDKEVHRVNEDIVQRAEAILRKDDEELNRVQQAAEAKPRV